MLIALEQRIVERRNLAGSIFGTIPLGLGENFQATPIVTSQFGQLWPKFCGCFDFPENLHIAQLNDADFKSGDHFQNLGKILFV